MFVYLECIGWQIGNGSVNDRQRIDLEEKRFATIPVLFLLLQSIHLITSESYLPYFPMERNSVSLCHLRKGMRDSL